MRIWLLVWMCGLSTSVQLLAQEKAKPAEELTVDKASGAKTRKQDELVIIERGELPIVLSAPHGGTKTIPHVEAERQGKGMEKGPKGFFTERDGGTEELALDIARAIEHRLGKRPYIVISSIHRKYLDFNRPPEIAFEDPNAKPVYNRYHEALAEYCKAVQNKYHAGLLLDIHGKERNLERSSEGLETERR